MQSAAHGLNNANGEERVTLLFSPLYRRPIEPPFLYYMKTLSLDQVSLPTARLSKRPKYVSYTYTKHTKKDRATPCLWHTGLKKTPHEGGLLGSRRKAFESREHAPPPLPPPSPSPVLTELAATGTATDLPIFIAFLV